MDNTDEGKKERSTLWQALSLAWNLGYLIAVPLVVFALLGRFLDKRFGTSPLALLVGIFISLVVTTIGVYKKTKEITKEMESDNSKIKSQKSK
ncbi:MAG: AtpZ/AtpI family protein [Patescibacteria group bacterium]